MAQTSVQERLAAAIAAAKEKKESGAVVPAEVVNEEGGAQAPRSGSQDGIQIEVVDRSSLSRKGESGA